MNPAETGPMKGRYMKWITRERVKVDRVACPWLIKKFVDPDATFLFVPADQVMAVAEQEEAVPYDVKGVELGHHGKECSFDAIVRKYLLDHDPALILLAKIVNGADTDNSLWNQPEAAGLNAIAEGFRHLGFEDSPNQRLAVDRLRRALCLLPGNDPTRATQRFVCVGGNARNKCSEA
jgi:hypothetical protein